MVVALAEVVDAVAHIGDDAQSQLLCLVALAVMMADECHETFCQPDEADAQRTLIDDALHRVVGAQLVAAYPQALHQQRELLGQRFLLKLEAVVELLRRHLQHVVELGKELPYALLLVVDAATFQRHAHQVDGREREVAAAYRRLRPEAVFKHTRAAAHRGHLVLIALRIVGTPLVALVERCVEVEEIGEEPARRHLAGQLIEVEVAVFGQVVHAALLLPYLNGENGRLAVADAIVGAQQNLAHHAAALGAGVSTVVDAGEHHLIAAS